MTPSEDSYSEPIVQTSTGLYFNAWKPDFRLSDIAHALSNVCRFNGHTSRFYSVAQHSILVSEIMRIKGADPFEGLMHDGTEAYLGDIASPFKAQLPDYREFEATLDRKLRNQFNLPLFKTTACKLADWYALFIEAHYLLPDGGAGFADPHDLRHDALMFNRQHKLFTRIATLRDPELDFKIGFYDREDAA